MTEAQYWGLLESSLRDGGADSTGASAAAPTSPSGDARSAFASLLDAVSSQTQPVLLILDDLHLVADPIERVDDLLAVAPEAGLRIIAATRISAEWAQWIDRHVDQTLIPAESLAFNHHEIGALLRNFGIEHDHRAPGLIHSATEGSTARNWRRD